MTVTSYLEILAAIVATAAAVALCVFFAYGVSLLVKEWREL